MLGLARHNQLICPLENGDGRRLTERLRFHVAAEASLESLETLETLKPSSLAMGTAVELLELSGGGLRATDSCRIPPLALFVRLGSAPHLTRNRSAWLCRSNQVQSVYAPWQGASVFSETIAIASPTGNEIQYEPALSPSSNGRVLSVMWINRNDGRRWWASRCI